MIKESLVRFMEQVRPKEIGLMNTQDHSGVVAEELAELFRTFADATRIRILEVLSRGEICVNDLADKIELTQPAVSHQLRILKQNRLVKSRRDGKQILYSLDDEHVHLILKTGAEHIQERFQET